MPYNIIYLHDYCILRNILTILLVWMSMFEIVWKSIVCMSKLSECQKIVSMSMPHLLITGLIIYSVPKTCHLRTAPFYSQLTHYGETYSYLCDYPQTRYRGTFCTFFYVCIAVLFSCRHTTHRHTIQRDLLSFTFFFYFYLCIALLFTWDTPHTDTETQTHYIAGLTITHERHKHII